jgi:WXG100 family type VII secretion target
MPARRIRADYDSLTRISQSFGRQAAATNKTIQQIQRCVGTLQGGDWIGKGAMAFYREMEGEVLPALKRLAAALEAASRLTQQASQIMHQAEDEAAGIFQAAGIGGIAGGIAAGLGTLTGMSGGAASGGIGFDEFEDFLADYVAQYGSFQGSGDVLELERPETESPFSTGADSKYGAGGGGGSAGGGGGGGSGSGNAGTVIESQGDKFAGGAGLRASGVSLGSEARGFVVKGSIGGGVVGGLSARGEIGLNIGGANIGIGLKAGDKPSIGMKVAGRASARLPLANLGLRFIGKKK